MTTRKTLSPIEVTELLALRELGYTVAAISDKLNISVRTVQRHIASHGATKGKLKQEVLDRARNELLELVNSDDRVRLEASKLIADDIAHTNHIRNLAIEATEHLTPKTLEEAALTMRALAAYSVVIKNSSDTRRHSLGLDKLQKDHANNLPEIVVRTITDEEVAIERKKAITRNDELDIEEY